MSKPKIAWLSPLPPQKSGIANYSYWILKGIGPYVDVDLYCDETQVIDDLKNEFHIYPLTHYPDQHQKYDQSIYHLGNNSIFHKDIYKLAWNFPSTIVLHDYNISAFMHDAFYLKSDWQLYEQALISPNGESETKKLQLQTLIPGLRRNVRAFPMSHAVVNKSKKVIVHHRWLKYQFALAGHIHVIPHFAKINQQPTNDKIQAFKKRFLIDEKHFVITCLGFINSNKLPQLQVEVVRRLLAQGYPVHLVFAGQTAPELKTFQAEVEGSENITFTGYLDEEDYFSALFASDVVINLRNPSMGEASGTLMHALAAAKPTIISDVNQYKEFPDKVCWKVTHDENESQLLYEYLTVLLANRSLREAMSENSADYVSSVLALDRVIPQWLRILFDR